MEATVPEFQRNLLRAELHLTASLQTVQALRDEGADGKHESVRRAIFSALDAVDSLAELLRRQLAP